MTMNRYCKTAVLVAMFLVATAIVAYPATQRNDTTSDTLYARLQKDVNDSGTTFFTEAEAYRWMDEAVQIIASYCRCVEQSTLDIVVTSGTKTYSISDMDHYDIEAVVYDYSTNVVDSDDPRYYGLEQIDLQDIAKYPNERGRPLYWFEWGGEIGVWPVSSISDSIPTTITVYLAGIPSTIDGTGDSISTPYYFNPTILLYLKAKYHEKNRDENRSSHYRDLFYKSIESYMQSTRRTRPLKSEN